MTGLFTLSCNLWFNHVLLLQEEMEVEAVSVGAILSDYQRIRVENKGHTVVPPQGQGCNRAEFPGAKPLAANLLILTSCARLDLKPLAYLWERNQADLLREMISSGLQAIVIKVAALGAVCDAQIEISFNPLTVSTDSCLSVVHSAAGKH
ncbi:hypothetical protein DNTS_008912 [Danionella cerebrum]|uniref:Diphthine--ammonia ligase n=1 Tax=Danionella cerebrum TaxID=2873325 RepID=A0A553NWA3_9TELE|nr:hypothetical protein DNTS_008912 [Danionella translucida]